MASRSWLGLVCLAGCWVALAVAGFVALQRHQASPGDQGTAPERVPPAADRLHLLLFLHPRCPCSRATLAELARLLAPAGDRLAVTVSFCRPADPGQAWEPTDLWHRAAALPGVRVVWDDGGEDAARCGARTSGDALLYDAAGRLRFRGGLTVARGHEGDSPGRDAVLAVLAGDAPDAVVTVPVYGCPLILPTLSTENP